MTQASIDRTRPSLVDPRDAYARPPFPRREDRSNGDVDAIEPRPDHGEDGYVGSGRLTGRRALITGADSGIGRAVAIAFAREGADVVISYLHEEDDAADTIAMIQGAGRRGLAIGGDISDEAHCGTLIERTVDELGGLDILVNDAATQTPRDRIEDVPTEEWERILRVNLTAPFWLCRAAAPVMPAGSSIINVASIQAAQPSPNLLAYATTKGGLVTFSKALSEMLGPRGIRVNVVAPGPVLTPLVATTTDPDELMHFGEGGPLGRPAQPAELAGAFVYLASPEASYVTGAVVPVTGGSFYA
ncbi:MAG TPA: glucose 1-dehydrogenase [Candidatus Saccharimonadales bacterium]|nr:glucose 1-dehydrogenase [Candidatus Saccharimonadales bacterium]